MAETEEKIYPASPRKRKKAREDGQVAKSTELVSLVTLFLSLMFIYFTKDSIFKLTNKLLNRVYININKDINIDLVTEVLKDIIVFIAPLFVVIMIAAFLSNYVQVGLIMSGKVLKPDLKKINPINGFKRMFSKDTLVELLKSLLKVTGVLAITFLELKTIILKMNSAYTDNAFVAFEYIFNNLFNIVIKISLLLLGLSILDYIYKRYKFEKDLKMTRQEMMDEYKEEEGSPLVKQKQREFARMLTKKQIQKVKEATVVITNPTHYAVALKYDPLKYPAPIVLFKGVDEIAQAAKKIAASNNVPIIENKPLARGLYASTQEGQIIPEDMFEAVATIIYHVYELKK